MEQQCYFSSQAKSGNVRKNASNHGDVRESECPTSESCRSVIYFVSCPNSALKGCDGFLVWNPALPFLRLSQTENK